MEPGRYFDERAAGYDTHMKDGMGLAPFYEAVAGQFEGLEDGFALLDLGVGTGLQLERLYARYPGMRVTGIDLSAAMLEQLNRKLGAFRPRLLCGSYLEADLGQACFDCALTTYSLHHLTAQEKQGVYRRVYAALKPGGFLVEGDLTAGTQAQVEALLAGRRAALEAGTLEEGGHFDIPCTAAAQVEMLKEAGFGPVAIVRQWEHTTLVKADR